jgi:hypothetical protein
MTLTQNSWLSAFDTTAHADLRLKVDVTNTSGTVTTSYISISDLTTYDRGDIPVGAVQLNAASLSGESQGTQPIIDATTKSYDVTVVNFGTNKVTNGDFSSATGWTLGGAWGIAAGVASNGPTTTSSDVLSRTLSLSTSTTYVITAEKVSHAGDFWTLDIKFDNTTLYTWNTNTANGTKSKEFTTASSISNQDIEIDFNLATGATITIDNVLIYQISTLSETITFEMDGACLDKEITFYWENRLGGLDNYTFHNEERGISVNKKTYVKPLTRSFTNESRGRTTLGGESNNNFTAYTRPLKDNELKWLEELFEDRMTYILDGSNFVPVTVTKNSVQTVKDGLVQLSVNYAYANNKIILGK